MMTRALAPLFALLVACSGGDGASKETETPAEPQKTPEELKREESLRALRAAQESSVEAMCERLADCAVEDAQKNMSPEERQKGLGNVEELLPRYRAECEEEANRSDLSPRQVQTIQRCVTDETSCETFVPCLDQVQKQG
jgi:hypothetical protein